MPRTIPGDWYEGAIPDNARIDPTAYMDTAHCFQRFRSELPEGVRMGASSAAYLPTMFDVGPCGQVLVGDFAMLNGPRIICDQRVEIGPYCLISWNVLIMDCYRVPLDAARRRAQLIRSAVGADAADRAALNAAPAHPVTIESNVWIGFDAVLLPGSRIGEGSIVGARSVVRGEVPPYTIAVGSPARVVRSLR